MSSVFGHSVAAITVYLASEAISQPLQFINRLKVIFLEKERFSWLLWLIVIASIPDLDYLVKAWHSSNN